MALDFITTAKIKAAETKWEQISRRLAFMEEQQVLETRPEERFRREHEISRMKQERQQLEQELAELQGGGSTTTRHSMPEQEPAPSTGKTTILSWPQTR